jgi:anaerobic selenocysteine-containing dehydrogenase
VARPGGFQLPNPVNEGVYRTPVGKALFTRNEPVVPKAPAGHLLLQTMRSHDQWNTVPYTLDDRYRGIHGSRHVVLVNPADLSDLGLAPGDRVDLVSVWADGTERRAAGFQVVSYPTAKGSAAAYYPETNVLVPLDSVADVSNQPTSKGIVVRLEPTPDRSAPAPA